MLLVFFKSSLYRILVLGETHSNNTVWKKLIWHSRYLFRDLLCIKTKQKRTNFFWFKSEIFQILMRCFMARSYFCKIKRIQSMLQSCTWNFSKWPWVLKAFQPFYRIFHVFWSLLTLPEAVLIWRLFFSCSSSSQ